MHVTSNVNHTLGQILNMDFQKIADDIAKFISDYVAAANFSGVVIGLSGGLDSSVLAKLCAKALGSEKVMGLILPSSTTPKEDVEDAIKLATSLGLKYEIIDINSIIKECMSKLPDNKKAKGNLMARVRMSIIYHYALVRNSIVIGTSDKSELYIGYFTKYGDGGADVIPIADLYKTQVRALGKAIGVPSRIIEKKSSPRLWDNHIAEEEIGLEYEVVDAILHLIIDKRIGYLQAAKELDVSVEQVEKIQQMIDKSAHKRNLAKIAHVVNY